MALLRIIKKPVTRSNIVKVKRISTVQLAALNKAGFTVVLV